MNRGAYRPPQTSRASASTLCQKCLKRDKPTLSTMDRLELTLIPSRHYSYECKATAQDRPYIARPSRTQQLLNPKLAPKLSSDTPNDLMQKKGIADAQLAKSAAERGRKRSMSPNDDGPRKRSRSIATVLSSSVSTISTSRSRSDSRQRRPSPPDRVMTSQYDDCDPLANSSFERKRRRRSSNGSNENYEQYKGDRNTRRRRSERSPDVRGRRTSRMEDDEERRSKTVSRNRNWQNGRRSSRSMNRARHNGVPGSRSPSPFRRPREAFIKERSMSPYSKRLALTQAMNSGH